MLNAILAGSAALCTKFKVVKTQVFKDLADDLFGVLVLKDAVVVGLG